MKKTTLFLVFCGLLTAQADFVYKTGSSFTTTADLDGDGRSDLVLVDGPTASVRVGYQLSPDTLTWSAPRLLGMDEVTDISCGNVLSGGHDVLVATAPLLNRYHIYHLNSPSQPPVSLAAHALGLGSKSVVAMDIGGGGDPAIDDLFSVSVMNGSSPFLASRTRSDGATLSPIGSNAIAPEWMYLNEVEYKTGSFSLGVISSSTLRLYDLSSGGISQIDYVATGLSASAAYVAFIPQGDAYVQFLSWEPGQSDLKAVAMTEPSAENYNLVLSGTYDLGAPITSIQLVQGDGVTRLAVVFSDGVVATIYDYDGTGAPASIQTLTPPEGERLIGFLPVASDGLVALSSPSGALDGTVTVDQHTFSGGQFVSTGTQTLPSLGNKRGLANVMTFASEPFVNNTPRRLQLLRAGDWASESTIKEGNVISAVETDQGPEIGLGNIQDVSLGSADASAVYTLDNQLHAAISTYSFDSARGDELVGIILTPDAGVYGTAIDISFATLPSAAVYYRTSSSDDWVFYATPFTLFKDTTVQYYAVGGTGQTIIREAVYTFSESPSDLDSDGDGVPDYVELANGLDPFESGFDSDGDGYSDLEELIAGSDASDASSYPASRLELGSVFDHAVAPFPIVDMGTGLDHCEIGTQVRLFSPSGGLMGFAKATNHTLNLSIVDPSSLFEAVAYSDLPFFTSLTDTRFDVWGFGDNDQRGVEMAGVYLQPTSSVVHVSYTYQGGDLSPESAAWLSSARSAYTNQTRMVQGANLSYGEVVTAVLVERKLADLLVERNVLTNGWVSLFKGRPADQGMPGFKSSDLQSLEQFGENGEEAYDLRDLIISIEQAAQTASLGSLSADIYGTCAALGGQTNTVGKYPLPIDVLREFVFSGTLNSNYVAAFNPTPESLAATYLQTTQILAQVPVRPTATFTLMVQADSFDAACPVLYTGAAAAKSLYNANGTPFRFPITFTLQPGAQVSVEAFTDPDWNRCPGTDPLEVISLALTAVPTASGADANGNLLPDDYEGLFLVGSGGLATSDLDGDGFSDLQEYLDQTDPNSAASHGAGEKVDFSPPLIWIDSSDLAIDWPAAYADAFVFIVELTDDLPDTPFAEETELPRGDLDVPLDLSADQRFYRVKMRLR